MLVGIARRRSSLVGQPNLSGEMNVRRRSLLGLLIGPAFAFLNSAAASTSTALPPALPEQEEFADALEGAPSHLREEAGVLVLRAKGYERLRESRNGFNCLLVREWGRSFEPTCFDAEGSRTILPVVLYQVELRASGKSDEEIDAAVA